MRLTNVQVTNHLSITYLNGFKFPNLHLVLCLYPIWLILVKIYRIKANRELNSILLSLLLTSMNNLNKQPNINTAILPVNFLKISFHFFVRKWLISIQMFDSCKNIMRYVSKELKSVMKKLICKISRIGQFLNRIKLISC